MEIKTSLGEVVDKYTILEIKRNKITDPNKLININKEYDYLFELIKDVEMVDLLKLRDINEKLWVIEDEIREKELRKEFDSEFIELARSVYFTNDIRAQVKKEINIKYGSEFVEEKSYKDYNITLLEQSYLDLCNTPSDINEHLPIIREYADKCNHITEFGVRYPVSTWAMLSSFPDKMISYDITMDDTINDVIKAAKSEDIDFTFNLSDVLKIEIESTDLLFIDTLHTYTQLSMELRIHSKKVNKYIILHDTFTYGFKDEEIYGHASNLVINKIPKKVGLRNAIIEFLNENDDWVLEREYLNNNGLTILKRII